MAKNPNHGLENRHVSVVAQSGGGKSQLMRNDIVPKQGQRVLLWDVDFDHKATRFDDWGKFMKALNSAHKSGKPFRIAWVGEDSPTVFARFCDAAWRILDGSKDTWIVLEEMADLNMKEDPPEFLRKLLTRGRKYGAIVVVTTQRCQMVPKMLITQPKNRYYGQHEEQDAAYMERLTRIKAEEYEKLEPLTFFRRGGGKGTTTFTTKYRKYTP